MSTPDLLNAFGVRSYLDLYTSPTFTHAYASGHLAADVVRTVLHPPTPMDPA